MVTVHGHIVYSQEELKKGKIEGSTHSHLRKQKHRFDVISPMLYTCWNVTVYPINVYNHMLVKNIYKSLWFWCRIWDAPVHPGRHRVAKQKLHGAWIRPRLRTLLCHLKLYLGVKFPGYLKLYYIDLQNSVFWIFSPPVGLSQFLRSQNTADTKP